jgi:cytochrome c peroxidase
MDGAPAAGLTALIAVLALACANDVPAGSKAAAVTALDGTSARDNPIWRANEDRVFPTRLDYPNALGMSSTVLTSEAVATLGHPFFTALGANGRACITCHQPADGMSLSTATLNALWNAEGERNPVFAAVDGSNCPNLPQADAASHSLLLRHGLFRIWRPWPPSAAAPEFELEVVRDPTGCNTDPTYGVSAGYVSIYRRPRPATNLPFVTAIGFAFDPKNGLPLAVDPESGQPMSGNVLSDVRAGTLEGQVRDALVSHAEFRGVLDPGDLQRIVAFERSLFTAQSSHTIAGALNEAGAMGGAEALATFPTGVLQSSSSPIWSEFIPWQDLPAPADGSTDAQRDFRVSVGRGATLFSKRMFLVTDSAGITDTGFGNPVRNGCAFCHNMKHSGLDVAPGQVDLGTTNLPHARLAVQSPGPELPLFRLTCREGARPHPHLGRVVYTHDPGYALTTGKCIDIGKITAQPMRGLAARAPYFSNGAAKTLREVVDFYNERYAMKLTDQEIQDLTNFLEVL